MQWQKEPITSSLLLLSKDLQKMAVMAFKVIQRACGERAASVHARVPLPLQGLSQSAEEYRVHLAIKALTRPPTVLEEIRWLIEVGIASISLRDEIYLQLCKQLNNNPHKESRFRGWQLMCAVLSCGFSPSSDLHAYLQGWIAQSEADEAVGVMAEYCTGRLESIQRTGSRSKPPLLMEIQCALENPFNPTVFGVSLEKIMQTQQQAYPDAKIPIILNFLTDAMLAMNVLTTRGIFRIAGNEDKVVELRVRIERGHYSLVGLLGPDNDGVMVLASLLKLWLRELEESLIPAELYRDCIDAAAAHRPSTCVNLVVRLPPLNRRVVLFIVSFLQLFCAPTALAATRLTVDSLAQLFAPYFFRVSPDHPSPPQTSSSDQTASTASWQFIMDPLVTSLDAASWRSAHWEQQFVKQLLQTMDCSTVDPEYSPAHGEGPEGNQAAAKTPTDAHFSVEDAATTSHLTSSLHGYANPFRLAAWGDDVLQETANTSQARAVKAWTRQARRDAVHLAGDSADGAGGRASQVTPTTAIEESSPELPFRQLPPLHDIYPNGLGRCKDFRAAGSDLLYMSAGGTTTDDAMATSTTTTVKSRMADQGSHTGAGRGERAGHAAQSASQSSADW